MLANQLRPATLSGVVGQEQVVTTLENAFKQGKVPSTMLFVGPHGTGKTTVARIVAKELGCPEPLEIDGATNRGIEDARNLKRDSRFVPMSGTEVVIIDEFHMMTREAFNALLKLLEEPPDYMHFILVTTDIGKVPKTVRSRCSKFSFLAVHDDIMLPYLREVAEQESIEISEDGLAALLTFAEGSLRDALNALEQVSMYSDSIREQDVRKMFGLADMEQIKNIFKIIKTKDIRGAILFVDELMRNGTNGFRFCQELMGVLEKLIKDNPTQTRQSMYKHLCDQLIEYDYSMNDKAFILSTVMALMEDN